jgi:hypothetical protein
MVNPLSFQHLGNCPIPPCWYVRWGQYCYPWDLRESVGLSKAPNPWCCIRFELIRIKLICIFLPCQRSCLNKRRINVFPMSELMEAVKAFTIRTSVMGSHSIEYGVTSQCLSVNPSIRMLDLATHVSVWESSNSYRASVLAMMSIAVLAPTARTARCLFSELTVDALRCPNTCATSGVGGYQSFFAERAKLAPALSTIACRGGL